MKPSTASSAPVALRLLALAAALAAAVPASAEVEKSAQAGADGIEMNWWPKLPPLPGWTQDKLASVQYGANVLVPYGKRFEESGVAIYAMAQYRPRLRDIHSLSELMESDRNGYAGLIGSVQIKSSPALVSGDRNPVSCMVVQPVTSGIWERDCYLTEGDYFLTFSLRAQNQGSFGQAMRSFETLISTYRQ